MVRISSGAPRTVHEVSRSFHVSYTEVWSGDRILLGMKFSAPVQTDPETHPASCAMGTGSLPEVRCGRGVTLTPHPF
jgi:hypothetical protein